MRRAEKARDHLRGLLLAAPGVLGVRMAAAVVTVYVRPGAVLPEHLRLACAAEGLAVKTVELVHPRSKT